MVTTEGKVIFPFELEKQVDYWGNTPSIPRLRWQMVQWFNGIMILKNILLLEVKFEVQMDKDPIYSLRTRLVTWKGIQIYWAENSTE